MRVLVAVCSKKRPEVFAKYAKPFLDRLPFDKILVLEQDDVDSYEFDNIVTLTESNRGLTYALGQVKRYAQQNNYDLIFKIDDDVKTIGNVEKDLDKILERFKRHPKLGAVCFPYKFEFYAVTKKLFSHINKRLQTCYIIRTEAYAIDEKRTKVFEDFYSFMMLRRRGYSTLFCSRHAIDCKPVGGGKGGIQCFDRAKLSEESIREFKGIDNTIEVVYKPDKKWKYEPKFTHKLYKARKI